MSGHSHWAGIKHKKSLEDAKKGKIFSKLSRVISLACREGGTNPEVNSKLKQAIEEAKRFNMPKENIERILKRFAAGQDAEELESILVEIIGENGIVILLEGITDNKNRALLEIKQIVQKYNFKIAQEGSVKWQFERKGVALLNLKKQKTEWQNKEALEFLMIEGGAEDLSWFLEDGEDFLEIRTSLENLNALKQKAEANGIILESIKPAWVAKDMIFISEEQKKSLNNLFEALEENEAVQEIYSNIADL